MKPIGVPLLVAACATAAAAWGEGPAANSAIPPLDSPQVHRADVALLALDLAEVERQRSDALALGLDVDRGPLALVSDASRLLRCRPLAAVPPGERPRWAGLRQLLRLEAVRIAAYRSDGLYPADPDIARMLVLSRAWVRPESRAPPDWVAWPLTVERWPGEHVEPALEASSCAVRAQHSRRDLGRDAAGLVEVLIADGPPIPPQLRARVLLHGLANSARLSATASVAAWLDDGEPAIVSAAALRLARRAETLGRVEEAVTLYRRALKVERRSDAEDGWARARLVALVSSPDEVIELTRGARAARPQDAAALAHAEARALYGRGELDALERFGRAWLARRGAPDILGFDAATEDLLVTLALARPAERAVSWTASLGSVHERDARLDKLALRALETGRLELAAYVYDTLRREAETDRGRGGAPAVARLTHALTGRARVEQARGDTALFADYVGELVHLARTEADRPLARTAPHRAIAVLCQALLGPLTEARGEPSSRDFARTVVDAIDALTAQKTRWSRVLLSHRAPLAQIAGVDLAPRKGKRPPPRIRSVGVVTLPRLTPALPAPDEAPPLPVIGSFWVRPSGDGTWTAGPPWPPPEAASAPR